MLRNNIVRQLGPNERPLNILRKCLLQFGYTDQDKLEELCGKDNSFLCRFTFEENGTPLTTEADIQDHADYADVNLQRRCLPTIPIFLYSKAKDIVRLNISHNQRMDLPLDFVQNCTILRELRMAYNDLGRVPGNVRSIIYLQVLDLRGNRIKDLEKAHLEDARELVTLLLQCNRLETIPNSFQTFEYLRILNLSGNNFSKVPLVLCRIASLEELDLSFNEIADIPEEIGQLSRLRKLLLFGNRIGPYLPSAIDRLLRLRKLDIRQNGILNLDAVSKLPVLQELLVDYNINVILSGSFKALVKMSLIKCNMTDINLSGTGETLTSLDLSSNKLSNLPPTLFENLRSLEVLILENNSIGSIAGIGTMKRLKVLMIANNNLSSLPEEIGLLDSLITLDIHSNNLSELPTAIWRLSLISLNVSSNLLDTFPDPPKSTSLNGGSFSNSALTYLEGPMQMSSPSSSPSPSRPKHLPIPLPSQNTCVPYSPPLAMSLHSLCLSDNRLPDEVMYPLSYFTNLQILNLSHNYIAEIPRNKIPNVGHIVELYLSGNQLTSLPAEDIERLRNLRVLHVNGNRLTTLPAELGKINRLVVLDVGCNMLKYNISNWPYDWNWNWNLELKYLNMSGNKRLQIKRTNVDGAPVANRQGNLSEFGNLTHLRCLGLMDVTITDNVPENSVDRRVRTSMSTLHNMSYGMADTLGVGENLCIWDLVHPKFQTKEDESLFGLFDGRSDRYRSNSTMTSHLKDRFGSCLKIELEKLEGDTVSAIRRTFLGLDRELFALAREDEGRGGASALVAYIKGTTLYSANVGDAIAVLVKKSDTYQVVSQKHIPWNPTEASRIKRSGGFVSESGLLNDELDISRSFGQYHLVPIINSNPYIETTTLTEDDDFLIMASSAFWDVMSYTTAVDIAKAGKRASGDLMYASQKLRDIAISYGAKEHMVVMLIGVGDLFKERELDNTDYHQPTRRPKAAEGPDTLRYLPPEIEPPQGDVAMVFTDIKNSTKLWENVPKAMQIAIKEHFVIMRRQLRSIGGYEVKNEGDALMASFTNVPAAMLWCFKVQELLVNAEWPQDILDSAECKAIFNASDPQPMYRGLSVRMGIHWGRPVSDRDAVTRRMDYYGPMVNRAARICDCADGGEICVSSDVINVMHLLSDHDQSDSPQAEHIRELKKMGFGIIELGEKKLKGLETPENIHLIYSRSLAGRIAMASRGPVLEIVESTALDSASVRALQTICLRLERLASSGESTLVPLNCFSQLYMAKTGHFVEVFESLGKAIGTDPSYILRALQIALFKNIPFDLGKHSKDFPPTLGYEDMNDPQVILIADSDTTDQISRIVLIAGPEHFYHLALQLEASPELDLQLYGKDLFIRSAGLGYAPAQFKLGICYELGLTHFPTDPSHSFAWYKRAAVQGHADAELAVSGWYLTGHPQGLVPSEPLAYEWASKAARRGWSKAEYTLGHYHEVGIGVPQDLRIAKQWYLKAAARGNERALLRLLVGHVGLAVDYAHLKDALLHHNGGNPYLIHQLAQFHELREYGLVPDEDAAFELYAASAQADYAPAQYKLGACYEFGSLGCPQDPVQAVHWYSQGADNGHVEALLALAGFYLDGSAGRAAEQSDEEAFRFVKAAAQRGVPKAEYITGFFLEYGLGVEKNTSEARQWYHLACAKGVDSAERRLQDLEKTSVIEWKQGLK
ncbi:cysteinyl-tRNA synthetase [Podila verticillata]|nr:cysteinyl-tRNA synthetase [Podila verticillata]